MFRHWSAGYAETLAGLLGVTVPEVERRFAAMEAAALDEERYAAWLLFAVGGRKG